MKKSSSGSAPDSSQWLAPMQSGQTLKPGLYIVATPIGNLRDITLRALDVLAAADVIYCEDTRVTQKLLAAYGLSKKLFRCDAHTENDRAAEIIQQITQGSIVAYVSDAGTPGISDPGALLVDTCRTNNIDVFPVPGPNALITALSATGTLSPASFSFIGFLPPRTAARKAVLQSWKSCPTHLVVYESAQRVEGLLQDIAQILGPRSITIARELTKRFERFYYGTPHSLLPAVVTDDFKGEVVMVIGPENATTAVDSTEWITLLEQGLKTNSLREAVANVTAHSGLPRKTVYAKALQLTKKK